MKPDHPNEEMIFETARALTNPEVLSTYLEKACRGDFELKRRIERLLRAQIRADRFLAQGPLHFRSDAENAPAPERLVESIGTRIGHYRLLEQIGEGGFGVVFMAEQEEPVRRKVALKIIKLGMDTKQVIARFEAERQALALMDHPNIAKVLDAGSTEAGRPYFVMELVTGVPITQFCDKNKLPTEERLKLFIAVCQAIQHAHQKGVIHRDIKPNNILVTLEAGEPIPKVIDFGIAKAIDQRLTEKTLFTRFATMMGTPAYMSPEQAEMSSLEVDTRTDVYALGIMLYELLTGTTPLDEHRLCSASYAELQRLIREEEPQPPSSRVSTMEQGQAGAISINRRSQPAALSKLFRTDLDWIVLKALEKDRQRRYDTPNELLADVRRHLQNEPVLAKPPSSLYKAHKFFRRNKPAVLAMAAIVLTLLVALVLISFSYQSERALRQGMESARTNEQGERKLAQAAAERAQKEADRAQVEATRAARNELDARRNGYDSDMLLAQNLIRDNNSGAAIDLLRRYEPALATNNAAVNSSQDLRGWEWYHMATITADQATRVFRGHETQINDVARSPDGRWIASCVLNPVIHIRDAENASADFELNLTDGATYPEEIYGLAFSPNGKYLAAGCDLQRKIHVWAIPGWTEAFVLTNTYRITGLAFSPDGRFLAAGASPVGLVVWDFAARTPLADWPLPRGGSIPWALAFTADSQVLVYDEGGGMLGRWNTAARQQLPGLSLDEANMSRALFSEDGTMAATSTAGVTPKTVIWSLPKWREVYRLTNEALLALSSATDQLATTSGQQLHLWHLRTGEAAGTQIGHTGPIKAAAISQSRSNIITASADKTVRLWPLHPPEPRQLVLKLPTNEFPNPGLLKWQHLHTSSNARYVVTVQTNKTFTLWTTEPLGVVRRFPWGVAQILSVEPSSDGKVIAVGGFGGELILVDVSTGNIIDQTRFSTHEVRTLRFSPDGSLLAVAYQDLGKDNHWLEIRKTQHLEPFRQLESTGGTVFAAEFTPDNRHFLFGSFDSLAELVDLDSGQVVTFRGHEGRVSSVSLTPDARVVATCSWGEGVGLWDGRTGSALSPPFRGTAENYIAVALAPDGSRLAAGGRGVDIWDLVTERQVQALRTPEEQVQALARTKDMTQLITAGNEALRIWPADWFSSASTNTLGRKLAIGEEEVLSNLTRLMPSDMMPVLNRLVARGDENGFWKKVRGTARLWNGDLAGAAADNPAYAIPPRDPRCRLRQIDLSPYYNLLLVADGFHQLGVGLEELPVGLQELGGVSFDLRGGVQLASINKPDWNVPRQVTGVVLDQVCHKLHFLHASQNTPPDDGIEIGQYVLHYSDGQTCGLAIITGRDIRDWWIVPGERGEPSDAEVVWRGDCPLARSSGTSLRLWKRTYENPRPDVKIDRLDFISATNLPVPFLVALTLE